jgi:potassium/hydrogen antiporter
MVAHAGAGALPVELILLWASALLLAAVLASKASGRLGIPSLLLFLAIGMLAGEEGPGGIPFDDARLSQSLGVVALAFILFAGGLETELRVVRERAWQALSLSTVGVLLTAGLVGVFAHWLLNITWLEGMLLGSVVSSTDAAAVFSVLRSRGTGLKGGIRPLLELESGSNDPMAVFLTVGLIRLIMEPGSTVLDLAGSFVLQMTVGLGAGFAAGRAATWLMNRTKLESEGLYPVLSLAWVLLTYSGTAYLKGNGFLAVYVAGIVMGNADFIHKKSVARFHDGLAWLMQIAMFLTLGLLVYPSRVVKVAGVGLLMAGFLVLVARPVSVLASLALAKMPWRNRLMVSWVGLRGAVPIILATFPLLAGVPGSDLFFNIVFFIVLTSVLLQGTSLSAVAEWLRVREPLLSKREAPLEFVPTKKTDSELVDLRVAPASPAAGKQLVDLHLPKSVLVVLVSRDDEFLVPRGATVLEAGDSLTVLAGRGDIATLRSLVDPS